MYALEPRYFDLPSDAILCDLYPFLSRLSETLVRIPKKNRDRMRQSYTYGNRDGALCKDNQIFNINKFCFTC